MPLQLHSQKNVTLTVSATDPAGNPASFSGLQADIDDHAKAYCVSVGGNQVVVVSRGPLGPFTATVSALNASGAPISAAVQFDVVPADANSLALAPGPEQGWSVVVPDMPAGW